MGGLARKATIINDLKLDSVPVVILDTGDLFFAKNRLFSPNDNIEHAQIRANIIVDSYNTIGCDAFSPGARDFALGISYLDKLKEESTFNYVSCNLYSSITSEPLFDKYKIKNINGANIAFIGAVSSFKRDSVLVKEPIASIKATVDQVSMLSDFIILLFNGSDSDLDRLQASNIEVDLVLRSKGSSKSTDNGGRERIPLYSSGNKGKYLNKINISKLVPDQDCIDISLEESNIKLSNKRINNKRKNTHPKDVALEELYKDDQKVLNLIANHRKKIKESTDRINSAVNKIKSKSIALNSKIASNPSILKIVDTGMAKIPKGPPSHHHGHHGHKH